MKCKRDKGIVLENQENMIYVYDGINEFEEQKNRVAYSQNHELWEICGYSEALGNEMLEV